jgi:lipopolysaccharide biosynthesis glycosyltransferase
MKVFIGWDSREDIAYQVCKNSILSRTEDIDVEPLKLTELKDKGIYTRDVDPLSSTEFTFTRFLVPYLMNYQGWAIFVDCDFVFLEDIKQLFDIAKKRDYAVMCVMHNYKPSTLLKMDNKPQHNYPRKNWSSMMIFNCGHPANKVLTPDVVNTETGAYLHRFQWLEDHDLGAIGHEWNWLVGWYKEPQHGKPKAIHYTEGGPWFDNYKHCEYGAVWTEEKYKYLKTLHNPPEVPTVSEFEAVPDDVKDLFASVLKYKVDSDCDYYDINQETLIEKIKNLKINNVVSTDSEYRYERKGMTYDPILQNFVLGAGGQISTWDKIENDKRPVLLRGITKRKQMRACQEQGRDFYYVDTGYFGNGRKKLYHRITKNAMQNIGPVIDRPGDRLEATGISLTKFRPGSKILLCPPSAKVMVFYDLDLDQWVADTINEIKKHTDREIVIRLKKGRAERVSTDTMAMALSEDIHCLVTFNSIAATEALLLGKPAFTLGPNAAQSLCLSDLSKIEHPYIPTLDEVYKWASHLAYSQFTENEMRTGLAWKILTDV